MSSRAPHNPTHNAVSTPLLHNFGWVEYVLPDASFYYVHPTLRVTTDIDLRSTKKLELVTSYLDHKDAGAPAGLEIWLQNSSTSKHDFVPYRIWIDHRKRGVSFDSPLARDGDVGGSKHPGDDRECRYCIFTFLCTENVVDHVNRTGYGVSLLVVHGSSSSPYVSSCKRSHGCDGCVELGICWCVILCNTI